MGSTQKRQEAQPAFESSQPLTAPSMVADMNSGSGPNSNPDSNSIRQSPAENTSATVRR